MVAPKQRRGAAQRQYVTTEAERWLKPEEVAEEPGPTTGPGLNHSQCRGTPSLLRRASPPLMECAREARHHP